MTTNVLVSNLSADVTEQEIEELFAQHGAVVEVKLNRTGDPDNLTAIVKMELDRTTARVMADRRRDIRLKGKKLDIYVPLFL